jgi:UDP-3-O-[3-hydroxymyristoyl] N-acetylglucosamine deacetylase
MKYGYQTTLADRVEIEGVGVHSAKPARLVIHPADANSGIVFLRTGLPGGRERLIEAKWSNVTQTALCTVVSDQTGASVATIEHLMAALAGLNIDNALVEIDGPEMPIMDGSAAQFVDAIDSVGVVTQSRRRRFVKVLKTVKAEIGRSRAELRPFAGGFHLDVQIDFETQTIGRQRVALDLDPQRFRRDIARARTFGFVADVKKLWQAGFALGSSLENSVALDGDSVLNPEGLRYPDEFVRHKALDAVGDLALAGSPILGAYVADRPGHTLNRAMLAALFADRSAYEIIEGTPRRVYGIAGATASRVAAVGATALAPVVD